MRIRHRLLLFCLLTLVLGASLRARGAAARNSEEWSPQFVLSRLGVATNTPDAAADATGRVHILWVEKQDFLSACSYDTIVYTAIVDDTWLTPTDILLSPQARCVAEPAIAVGPGGGWLHVVWSDLYFLHHATAPVDQAISAPAWSVHVDIGPTNAMRPDVVVDHHDHIHVAYYRAQPDWQVCTTRSDDGGAEWMVPQCIHSAPSDYRIESVELAVDGRGWLHLVWTDELVAEGMSRGGSVFYARSTDDGETWDEPLIVDQKDERYDDDYGAGEMAVATVDEDEVHLAWAGPPSGQRWHQWSADGGTTWHPAKVVVPGALDGLGLRYFNGGQDLAVDSANRVHLLTSSAVLAHVIWDDGSWSALDILLPYNPYWPRLAISGGNRLYAVGAFLGGRLQGETAPEDVPIWFMSAQTDSPAIPINAVPTMPRPTSVPAILSAGVSPDASLESGDAGRAPTGSAQGGEADREQESLPPNSPSPVLLGVAPVLLMILLLVAVRSRRRR